MTRSIVYLLPDTNLFIQCRPLDNLDWSAWATFDEVHLIISCPVQREIDNQKNRGNDRVGRRARAASSLLRQIVKSDQAYQLVRESGPCVKLFVKPEYAHSPALADRLNYGERDDQLVGTVHEFAEKNPGADVRLLTHDMTPLATAKPLGLQVVEIPDEWLSPPESSEAEKKVKALEAELTRLKKAEPQFHIRCLNGEGEEIEGFESTFVEYEPLAEEQVKELMQRIKDRFPPETDFGSREAAERDSRSFGVRFAGTKEVFTPATDEEIATYRDEAYPQWLERCEKTLRHYHVALRRQSGRPTFCFLARNEGTRPAKDALITIEARGNFTIRPPQRKRSGDNEDDGEQQEQDRIVKLPRPPAAPRGKWETTFGGPYTSTLGSIGALQRSMATLTGYDPFSLGRRFDLPVFHHTEHDPNGFYFKPQRPMMPQSAFSLECDQWRHDEEDEAFEGEIYSTSDEDSMRGLLECRIQAANLSESAVMRVPVRVSITRADTFERVENLVAWLIDPGSG